MIELIYIGVPQTVASGAPVVYNSHAVRSCNCCEKWRNGSGSVKLKCGRYTANFSGNIAIPTGGTVGEISLAFAINGEVVTGTTMRVTPAAVNEYFNVSAPVTLDCGCCDRISVVNTSTGDILVDNPNLTVTRIGGA